MRIGVRAWVARAVIAAAVVQAGLMLFPGAAVRINAVLILAVVAWAASRHVRAAARSRGHARRVWAVGSVGLGLWTLAVAWFAIEEIPSNRLADHPSPADAPALIAMALAVVAMLMTTNPPLSRASRLRALLDALLLAVAMFGLTWLLALSEQAKLSTGPFAGPLIAYPILAIVVLSTALLLLADRRGREGNARTLLSAGVAVIAGAVLVSLATAVTGVTAYIGGAVLNMLGAALLGAAASYPVPDRRAAAWEPGDTVLGRLLPYLPVAVIFFGAGYVRLRTGAFDPVLSWTAYLLVAAVLARQFLTLWLNAELTRELERQRRRLAHQARHDPLTGLANRTVLADRVARAVAESDANGDGFEPAMLLVDLDGFKAINDSLGHAAGDELLVEVGRRLRECAGPQDTAARLGGDEFAVLIAAVSGPAQVTALAETIIASVSAPLALTDGEVTVRASVGGAIADPHDRADADRLLRDADVALYAAKADGRGRFRLADEHLRASARDQMELDRQLRGALHRGELEAHYQPIVELSTGLVTGAEALLRWRHPERGLLAPGAFLPTAEAAGLMPDIDRWVLAEACRQAVQWRRHVPNFSISVNISAGHLTNTTLVRDVIRALAGSGLPPSALVLELTETALVSDTEVAATVLDEIAGLGVRVALDDFGTGYSSLTYLRSLPIHTIKIDRSFVSGLGDGATNDAVTGAILDLAGTLGLHQVAEGVETDDQASRLRGLRCTYGQGYHFSRPVPAERLLEILTAEPPGTAAVEGVASAGEAGAAPPAHLRRVA